MGRAIWLDRLGAVLPLSVRVVSAEFLGQRILPVERGSLFPVSARNARARVQQAVAELPSGSTALSPGASVHFGRVLERVRPAKFSANETRSASPIAGVALRATPATQAWVWSRLFVLDIVRLIELHGHVAGHSEEGYEA